MVNVSFDGFDIRGEVERLANDHLATQARKAQRVVDHVGRAYRADPTIDVAAALQVGWSRALGERLDDQRLSDMVAAIKEGRRVTFGATKFRLPRS